MTSTHRRYIVAAAVVVLLFGVGIATYFSGGLPGSRPAASEPPREARFELTSTPAPAPLRPLGELSLPWGEDGVAVAEAGLSALEGVFAGPEAVYVVDHPRDHVGARVRWYRDGKLAGTHLAPPGSALFSSAGKGFAYVISKGDVPYERAVLVDATGSVVATHPVPLRLNSGGLQLVGDTLYTVAWRGFVNPDTREMSGADALVPVVIGGRPLGDAEAESRTVDAWRIAADGSRWKHVVRSKEGGDAEAWLERGGGRVRVPYEAVLLGADARGRAWIVLPPRPLGRRGVAGWPTVSDERGLLVALGTDGTVHGAMPLPVPNGANDPDIGLARRIGFDGERLSFVEARRGGVVIQTYQARP